MVLARRTLASMRALRAARPAGRKPPLPMVAWTLALRTAREWNVIVILNRLAR